MILTNFLNIVFSIFGFFGGYTRRKHYLVSVSIPNYTRWTQISHQSCYAHPKVSCNLFSLCLVHRLVDFVDSMERFHSVPLHTPSNPRSLQVSDLELRNRRIFMVGDKSSRMYTRLDEREPLTRNKLHVRSSGHGICPSWDSSVPCNNGNHLRILAHLMSSIRRRGKRRIEAKCSNRSIVFVPQSSKCVFPQSY